MTRVASGPGQSQQRTVLGSDLPSTPVNIGPRSTPSYADLADAAIHDLGGGMQVFAGQRDEGFFVDLGSIFDLATLRPFEDLHLIPSAAAVAGRSRTEGFNVHTIAIQAPKSDLTSGGSKPDRGDGPALDDRGVGGSAPPADHAARATASSIRWGRGCRSRGSPTRWSTRS